ncbi:HalOD1 output domain-containing protein [Halorussus marinus]|uniref:HalOD1 output domain-containing protein n=1 Tax=Halorussus marinus TaxID=2505976 RepID=UPI00143133B5|nr:HalOD1 output domain-containing protein [Halorussus marinus]
MATANPESSERAVAPKHEAYHDPDGDAALSTTVINAVAAAEGVDPTHRNLQLYDALDLEALDSLFERRSRGDHWRFEFGVHDLVVVVHGDGCIAVYDDR